MPVSPLDFGNDLLDRSERLAKRAGTPRKPSSPQSDMLRSSWTMVGAAIDTYFHERVRWALTERPISPAAAKFYVPLGSVEDMIDRFLDNRSGSRPRVVLKNIIHDRLLLETFQGSRNIENGFNLIGVKKPWATLEKAMGEPSSDIKNHLDAQYHRRNQIAHQGDYARQERPRDILYGWTDRTEVDAEIVWTRHFLSAADSAT